MIGVPSAPKATGAVLAISERPGGGERREAEADQDRRGHRHRRAEARGAFEERAEAEGDQQQLQAAVVGDVGDVSCSTSNEPVLLGQLVQEDDVEDDPADRQQPEEAAVERGEPRHFAGMPKAKTATMNALTRPRIAAASAP